MAPLLALPVRYMPPVAGSAAQPQVRHTLAVTHEAGDLAASTGNADGTPGIEPNYVIKLVMSNLKLLNHYKLSLVRNLSKYKS